MVNLVQSHRPKNHRAWNTLENAKWTVKSSREQRIEVGGKENWCKYGTARSGDTQSKHFKCDCCHTWWLPQTGRGGKQQWGVGGALPQTFRLETARGYSLGRSKRQNTYSCPSSCRWLPPWPPGNVINTIYDHYSISMTVCHFVCNVPPSTKLFSCPLPVVYGGVV